MTIYYYADGLKYFTVEKNPVRKDIKDKEGDQYVTVGSSLGGMCVSPFIRWTPCCEKLFRKYKAYHITLPDISSAPNRDLGFVNDLPACKSLRIQNGDEIDLSPLAGNRNLESLDLCWPARYKPFDFTTLPNLRQCWVPLCPELRSILQCRQLVSLSLEGGRHEGILHLETLPALEEFICVNVRGLKGVVFHPNVRLRSLELSYLRNIESCEPLEAITQELRVVELDHVPRMKIEWLAQAEKVECISLRLGPIPSIKFLSGLKNLRILDLFGSKVMDGDLSFRDSLVGEHDKKLWSTGKRWRRPKMPKR